VGSTVGLAAQLLAGLVIGSTTSVKGVTGCTEPLQAVLAVPMVWFKGFLAFNHLVHTLIWRRP